MTSKPASAAIARQQADLLRALPFSDTRDFEDANRGLIGPREPNAVPAGDGSTVWGNDTYDFIGGMPRRP